MPTRPSQATPPLPDTCSTYEQHNTIDCAAREPDGSTSSMSVGVTDRMHLGGADMFRMIAESPVGHERPETVDHSWTLAELIAILAASSRPPA